MSARDELRKYVHLLADAWTPREKTDDRVEWLYSLVRAEVRDEVAEDIHRAELPQFAATENPTLVAKTVRSIDVRLAEQGPQAPYGVEKGDQPADQDFFQLGHTYKHEAWTFRCDAITTHPDTGKRTVLGWFRFRKDTWRPLSCGEAEWAEGVWTDITTNQNAR